MFHFVIFVEHKQKTNAMNQNRIEFTSQSGEIVLTENFATELQAQNHFDTVSQIRWPNTYKGIRINASEFPVSMREGSMRLIAVNHHGEFCRRELFRNM